MASEWDVQLLVGELKGRVQALEEQNRITNVTLRDMADQLRDINETLSSAKGGWRTLLAIGSLGAALGGLVASFFK